jgi:hypothetical protein
LIDLKENLADLLFDKKPLGSSWLLGSFFFATKEAWLVARAFGGKVLLLKRGRDKPQNTGVIGLSLEKGFLTGFLILGFAIFIAGFLTGMLALSVLGVSSDLTTLGLMIFALGLVGGILLIALTFAFLKWSKKQRQTLSESELKTN